MNSKNLLGLVLVSVALAACSSNDDSTDQPPPPPTFSGDSLILDSVQNTSETSEPVAINGQDLSFSEDPHAFDSVLQ